MNFLIKKYPETFQFLAGYFNQDFTDEYGEPEAAVDDFIKSVDSATRAIVVSQLSDLVSKCNEDELDSAIVALGCYYYPQKARGITMTSWVGDVIYRLQSTL